MNHDAIVNATFPSKTEDGALIYCQAYKIGNKQSSNTALMLANNVATISSAYALLSIPNLLAITNYDIYCVTISSEGAEMPYETVLTTKKSVKTNGYRSIKVKLNKNIFVAGENYRNALELMIDISHMTEVVVSITTKLIDSSETVNLFSPHQLIFENSSVINAQTKFNLDFNDINNIDNQIKDYELLVNIEGSGNILSEVQFDIPDSPLIFKVAVPFI